METLLIFFIIICAAGIGVSVFLQLKQKSTAPVQDFSREMAKLEKDLELERREKNELSGKGKQLYDSYKNLEADYKATLKERDTIKERVTKFETRREQYEKEHREMIEKLETAQFALKEERERVIQEEQRRRQEAEQERDRIWAEHEIEVIASLTDLCKQPHLQFTSYSNTKLPEGFDGALKPDFLIEFLNQYVIFDAKASKAKSLQVYIDDAVKKTSEKLKKNPKIYPHVFLVVPTEAVSELKKHIYAKDEFYFYIVSREALAPILASLKRISTYELAEQLDPQKRENIINVIAELATHISYRNAYELLLTKHGVETLNRIGHVDREMADEVERKQSEKKLSQMLPSEIKRLAGSVAEQNITISQFVSPKPAIKKKQLEEAQLALTDEE